MDTSTNHKPYDPAACAELVRQAREYLELGEKLIGVRSLANNLNMSMIMPALVKALESALHEIEVRDRALNEICTSIECTVCTYRKTCTSTAALTDSNVCSNHIITQARRELDGAKLTNSDKQ